MHNLPPLRTQMYVDGAMHPAWWKYFSDLHAFTTASGASTGVDDTDPPDQPIEAGLDSVVQLSILLSMLAERNAELEKIVDPTLYASPAASHQDIEDPTAYAAPMPALGTLAAQNADLVDIRGGVLNAQIKNNQAILLETTTALTDGAAAAAGTLTNAPSAGDPTKWVAINDNGTTRYIPAW